MNAESYTKCGGHLITRGSQRQRWERHFEYARPLWSYQPRGRIQAMPKINVSRVMKIQ